MEDYILKFRGISNFNQILTSARASPFQKTFLAIFGENFVMSVIGQKKFIGGNVIRSLKLGVAGITEDACLLSSLDLRTVL